MARGVPPRAAREKTIHRDSHATFLFLASLPRRILHFVKVHYLDQAPAIAKARRLHLGREAYANRLWRGDWRPAGGCE